MNEQTFISRIGNWFRRDHSNGHSNGHTELLEPEEHEHHNGEIEPVEPRLQFLRPWARRDAAIENLQSGFDALTDLMGAVRDNLERQGKRQDQLLDYLSHLPRALETLPESNRVQAETLKAIHQQMDYQNGQQQLIAEILERINASGGDQKQMIDAVRERVETLHEHDGAIAENLKTVSAAMAGITQNSSTGTAVLEQMRDKIDARGGELERILQRQNTRFTSLLAIAIFLSVLALASVATIGFLLYTQAQA